MLLRITIFVPLINFYSCWRFVISTFLMTGVSQLFCDIYLENHFNVILCSTFKLKNVLLFLKKFGNSQFFPCLFYPRHRVGFSTWKNCTLTQKSQNWKRFYNFAFTCIFIAPMMELVFSKNGFMKWWFHFLIN